MNDENLNITFHGLDYKKVFACIMILFIKKD